LKRGGPNKIQSRYMSFMRRKKEDTSKKSQTTTKSQKSERGRKPSLLRGGEERETQQMEKERIRCVKERGKRGAENPKGGRF